MRPWLPLMLAASACGGAPAARWPDEPTTFTIPLVEAWRPRRLLVEAMIEGRGPLLVIVDSGYDGAAVAAPFARALRLPFHGDPARDPASIRADLTLGDLELRATRLEVADVPGFGELFGRPIVGVIGSVLFEGSVLETVSGELHVYRRDPPAAPPGASVVELRRLPGRALFTTDLNRAGGSDPPFKDVLLSTGALRTRVRTEPPDPEAEDPPEPPALPRVRLGPRAPIVVAEVFSGGPAGLGGVVALDALIGRAIRVDAPARRLVFWPEPDPDAHLRRFPDVPACGADFRGCTRARIIAVEPGRVTVRFDPPKARLPPRYWLRVDLGRLGAPRTALFRLTPHSGADFTAVVYDPTLTPTTARSPGELAPIVDLVPVGARCGGDVCTLRGEAPMQR